MSYLFTASSSHCVKLFGEKSKMRHTGETQISLRNIRVPYIFLNITLVRTYLQGSSWNDADFGIPAILCFLCKSHKPNILQYFH